MTLIDETKFSIKNSPQSANEVITNRTIISIKNNVLFLYYKDIIYVKKKNHHCKYNTILRYAQNVKYITTVNTIHSSLLLLIRSKSKRNLYKKINYLFYFFVF